MTHAISSSPVQANAQVARAQSAQPAPSAQKTAQTNTPAASALGHDTVQISKAAQLVAQAMKEAAETPSQTAQEARRGDHQAQRLLAKEAADKTA